MTDKREDKREIILQAAEALFAEHGFTGTSTRALAQRAGVNLGMLSYYFGTKEKIFEALIESRIIHIPLNLDALHTAADYWQCAGDMVTRYVDTFMAHPGYYRSLHREISLGNHPEMRDLAINLILPNKQRVQALMEKGMEAGFFRKADIPMILLSFFGTVFHLLNSECMTQRLLGSEQPLDLYSEAAKNRLKTHLNALLRLYLQPLS